MNIVAIGGGDVSNGDTGRLDRELIALSGKANPNLLFIPTASMDAENYCQIIDTAYSAYGCTVSSLRLWGEDADPEVAARKIEQADAIYVGGGNTKALVARWQELGVDKALRAFVDSGRPVGGISAGALCWFRVGNSDWPQFEGIAGVNTARLDCLGFVDLVLCPHTLHEEFRMSEFRAMMQGEVGAGVGVDDGCALQIKGDTYRVIASQSGSMAHLVMNASGQIQEADMPPHEDFRPLADLRRGII